MSKTTVKFGYNNDLEHDSYAAWENMGTKYNFNIEGNALGIFSNNNHNYLLSQVTSSYGDNCMVGTIDAREVTIESPENSSYILLSNNEPSIESMTISRILSTAKTKQELATGMSIEQTTAFQTLEKLGITLVKQDFELSNNVTVCGIENEHFKSFQEKYIGSSK